MAVNEQMTAEQDGEAEADGGSDYRLSHMMDAIVDAFADREMVQAVAPLERGGLKPRVSNRVAFTPSGEPGRPEVETVLNTGGWAWTVGPSTEDGTEYVVLGQTIADLRELRKGDRIHLNKRGGPFKVFRVMEQPSGPEVLQRSAPAVTVELTNTSTGTDWMVVHWQNDSEPWSYCRTKDKHASGGFRYRKVESVERSGRIGPARMFAPREDVSADIDAHLPEIVADAKDGGGEGIHPTDLSRVAALFAKPIPDVFDSQDADTVRKFLTEMSEWYEREANALQVETEQDKERAAVHQDAAERCERFADAFNVLQMDAVDLTDDGPSVYACEDCGQVFLNQHKYPTHRRECSENSDANEKTDPNK